jgi:hypothetical protein
VLAGDGSHSTNQPSGRAQGQDRGRVGSSRTLPEKHITSKTEYTNTQQGLPGIGYTLARSYTHEGISKVLGLFSAEKQQRVDP